MQDRTHSADSGAAFLLPPGSEQYLTLQRTAYQHPIHRLFRRVGLGRAYDRYLLGAIERRRNATLGRLYSDDVNKDYLSIKSHLPARVENILDIGAGMAGIDIFLYKHYDAPPKITLLDKEGISSITYGFKENAAYYNSKEMTRSFLESNGVRASDVRFINVDGQGFPGDRQYDVVVSLISWGFHYPVAAYLQDVHKALAPGGALILDVRRGTDGLAELERQFGNQPVIAVSEGKFDRVVMRRRD